MTVVNKNIVPNFRIKFLRVSSR